jgi:hypothetical protein
VAVAEGSGFVRGAGEAGTGRAGGATDDLAVGGAGRGAGAGAAALRTDRMALAGAAGEPSAAAAGFLAERPLPRISARIRVASSSLIELLWLLAAMDSFSAASSTSLLSSPRSRDSS